MPSLTGTMKGIAVPPEEFNKLTQIPIILYFGDYIPENVTDKLGEENWRVRLQMGRKFVEAVNRHGGHAALVELPKIGIRGNTHFLMSDKTITSLPTIWPPGSGRTNLTGDRHTPRTFTFCVRHL